MKKLLLFLGILILASGMPCFADCDYKCVTPYDMNSKFRTFMGAVSGVNSVTEKAAEKILKKAILKNSTAEKLKINIDSFSSKDLKNGIFKSAQIQAENIQINDIYLSSLNLKTLCNFNYIKQSGKDLVFVEDFPMSFEIEVNGNDLNRTMQNKQYKRIINDLNKLGASYGYGLKIASTKAAIKSGKFYYILNLEVPFVKKTQKLVMEANVNVKNGKIKYYNTKLISGMFNLDLKKLDFILNYLNPLDFSVNIIENKDAKIKVKNIKIQNNTILTNGIIVIPKD